MKVTTYLLAAIIILMLIITLIVISPFWLYTIFKKKWLAYLGFIGLLSFGLTFFICLFLSFIVENKNLETLTLQSFLVTLISFFIFTAFADVNFNYFTNCDICNKKNPNEGGLCSQCEEDLSLNQSKINYINNYDNNT